MTAQHLLLLVEEQSMEAFLHCLLPRLLPEGHTFEVHPFRGKHDLRKKLRDRLRGYARWLPDEYRIIVMVDRDNDDCKQLKAELEAAATAAGLRTRSQAGSGPWQVANRIVRVGGVVLWRLAGGARRLSPRVANRYEAGALSRPGCYQRDLGSVRARLEAGWVLHHRPAQGGGGPGRRCPC